MKTAQQGSAKWVTNTGGSAPAWLEGINNTTIDVMGRAIAAAPAAVAAYSQNLTSGAWARAIQNSGGTANWKSMADKKSANFATGVAAGADKQATALGKIMQDMPGIVNGLSARGPVGSAQNYQRSAQVGTALHNNKGKYKG